MNSNSSQKQIQQALDYIDSFWDKIVLKPKKHRLRHKVIEAVLLRSVHKDYHEIAIPYTCVVPNTGKYKYVFYWDTYFIFQGLKNTRYSWVIPSMVQNFLYLFEKYHIIPNLSHPEALGRSQPPLLTSMIFDAYEVMRDTKKLSTRVKRILISRKLWLEKAIKIAQAEYEDVWQSDIVPDHKHYNHRVAEYDLNVYGSRDVPYPQTAEQESGWDMTSRFYNRCNEFLPVDLNTFLYKYEMDFAKAAQILGNQQEENMWLQKAEDRKKRINEFLWSDEKGFFYDYDHVHRMPSEFLSLAGFVPLWAGMATPQQAEKCAAKLPLFETNFGLSISDKASLPEELDLSQFAKPLQITLTNILRQKQWDYPNIWPPLEYITVMGLIRYGFTKDAKRIMEKSLAAHIKAFEKYGAMLEKLDGLTGDMPGTYWYPTQLGFGWTNAIFKVYTELLGQI